MFELHYQLRTEGSTPARSGLAVALGAFLGCIPIYGAHLFLCAVLARAFRLSRVRAYLAAHISNPVTFGPLTLLEFGVGHYLIRGSWPSLSPAEIARGGALEIGRDVLVGAVAVGTTAAVALGLVSWAIALRWSAPTFEDEFREEVGRRFTRTGILDWEFARAKLRLDPVHLSVLRSGALPSGGTLLDLGCGRGLLLATLAVARRRHAEGRWPDPVPPPAPDEMIGVDIARRRLRAARRAIAGEGSVRAADLSTWVPPPFRCAALIDVLHDLDADAQTALVGRLAAAVEPGGAVVVREIDGGRGRRAAWARARERLFGLARGRWRPRPAFRTAEAWARVFEVHGLRVESLPEPRPGEVLLVARAPRR